MSEESPLILLTVSSEAPAKSEADVQLEALGTLIAGAESALNTLELKGRELDVIIDRREREMAVLENEIDSLNKAGGNSLKLDKKRGELAALKVRVDAFRDTVKAHGIDCAKQGKALNEQIANIFTTVNMSGTTSANGNIDISSQVPSGKKPILIYNYQN